jgi:hypothetical protein
MRDFRELNQQVNEVKRMLNSFIQKLTAQVEKTGSCVKVDWLW